MTNHKLHGGAHSSAPGVTSERPSCKCEKALPGGCDVKWGMRRSAASRGRCGSGPESTGSWPGSLHLLPWLLPTWAAGSSLEGDVLHLGPQGTRQLSAQSHRLASQFLLLCRGVSAHT